MPMDPQGAQSEQLITARISRETGLADPITAAPDISVAAEQIALGGVPNIESTIAAEIANARASGALISGNALRAVVAWGACHGLDAWANKVYDISQEQVPRSEDHDYERHPVSLAESGKCPRNAVDHKAVPYRPVAQVSYETEYALAQHEGMMSYERNGKTVHWEAQHYTTPGTKKKYLADPMKQMLPLMERYVAAGIQIAMEAYLP